MSMWASCSCNGSAHEEAKTHLRSLAAHCSKSCLAAFAPGRAGGALDFSLQRWVWLLDSELDAVYADRVNIDVNSGVYMN